MAHAVRVTAAPRRWGAFATSGPCLQCEGLGAITARVAAIAQPVEHIIRNDGVGGSNPSCGTTVFTNQKLVSSALERTSAQLGDVGTPSNKVTARRLESRLPRGYIR